MRFTSRPLQWSLYSEIDFLNKFYPQGKTSTPSGSEDSEGSSFSSFCSSFVKTTISNNSSLESKQNFEVNTNRMHWASADFISKTVWIVGPCDWWVDERTAKENEAIITATSNDIFEWSKVFVSSERWRRYTVTERGYAVLNRGQTGTGTFKLTWFGQF